MSSDSDICATRRFCLHAWCAKCIRGCTIRSQYGNNRGLGVLAVLLVSSIALSGEFGSAQRVELLTELVGNTS